MKDIGLVGLPFSGKSTLFTALTRAGAAGGQSNQAVVPVPDPRLQVLTEMERSAKTVAAQVRFVDVPGGTSSAQGIAELREAEALAVVSGASAVTRRRPPSSATSRRAAAGRPGGVDSALRAPAPRRAGEGSAVPEVDALGRAHEALSAETPLRDVGLEAADLEHCGGSRR